MSQDSIRIQDTFKEILTFLGLDYRDASLITMYFVVLGISIKKNQTNRIILSHKKMFKKLDIKKHV